MVVGMFLESKMTGYKKKKTELVILIKKKPSDLICTTISTITYTID